MSHSTGQMMLDACQVRMPSSANLQRGRFYSTKGLFLESFKPHSILSLPYSARSSGFVMNHEDEICYRNNLTQFAGDVNVGGSRLWGFYFVQQFAQS